MAFDVQPGETLSRFITDNGHLRSNGTVRHNAFSPARTSGKLSVYWTTDLAEGEVWGLGNSYVAPHRGEILARADINSLRVYGEGLHVEIDGIPHPRHVNVVGWDVGSTKARLQSMKLADSAIVIRSPTAD